MWPGISQAPENVTCAAVPLRAGPLLCTHHHGKGSAHTAGPGQEGSCLCRQPVSLLFSFSPPQKEPPRLGITASALRCTVSLQGLCLCVSLSIPIHTWVNVYTSSQGEIFNSSVIYDCDLEKKCHVLVKKEGH